MRFFANLFAVTAVAGFRSDVVVKSHTPITNSTNMISAGLRREAGSCFFANSAQKRDATEYFVLNGVRTDDAFNNDCLDWDFTEKYGSDGTYTIKVDNPFFSGEQWNPGYLALQKETADTIPYLEKEGCIGAPGTDDDERDYVGDDYTKYYVRQDKNYQPGESSNTMTTTSFQADEKDMSFTDTMDYIAEQATLRNAPLFYYQRFTSGVWYVNYFDNAYDFTIDESLQLYPHQAGGIRHALGSLSDIRADKAEIQNACLNQPSWKVSISSSVENLWNIAALDGGHTFEFTTAGETTGTYLISDGGTSWGGVDQFLDTSNTLTTLRGQFSKYYQTTAGVTTQLISDVGEKTVFSVKMPEARTMGGSVLLGSTSAIIMAAVFASI